MIDEPAWPPEPVKLPQPDDRGEGQSPVQNTHKVRAFVASVASGLAYLLNWLATVPPEQQAGWLAQFVEITPLEWRPNVGLFTRFLGFFLSIYAVHQASKSGPASPPANNPNK